MAPTRSLHVAGEKLYVNTIKHLRSELGPAKGAAKRATRGLLQALVADLELTQYEENCEHPSWPRNHLAH
jgi:hypothetical protein